MNIQDAVGRLYDHDDNYLRILSLSFRRARTAWNMDREKMLQLLLEGEEEENSSGGGSSKTMDLWVADMALNGIDDTEATKQQKRMDRISGANTAAPSYLFRTTWLPYSKLLFTVLDWRLLGPPWRVTQWITGTLKNATRQDEDVNGSDNGEKKEDQQVSIDNDDDDAAATRPFRVVMSALRRYVTSSDLSLKCAISFKLDGGDDDDLSFFFESDQEDDQDDSSGNEQETKGQSTVAAGGAGGESKSNLDIHIQEEGDEAEAPNIAFALSNWEQGTNYYPKRREEEYSEEKEEKQKQRERRTTSTGLMDGTMAEFNITFCIQDLVDDKAAYDAACGEE